jgi:Carboxypeptidase regulatory-like domain
MVFAVMAVFLAMANAATPKDHWGKVKGVISDVYRSRVVNAQVTVEGDKSRRRLATNGEGKFEVTLPPGKYLISVDANGFRQYVSPEFDLKPGKTQKLEIELQVTKTVGLTPASSDPMPRESN